MSDLPKSKWNWVPGFIVAGFVWCVLAFLGYCGWTKAIQPVFFPQTVTVDGNDLLISGVITENADIESLVRLKLLKFRGETTVRVFLNSDGGYANAAIEMVKQLSKFEKVITMVPHRAGCESACGVIFAAGTERYADPEAYFMFHGLRSANAFGEFLGGPPDVVREGSMRPMRNADPAFLEFMEAKGVFNESEEKHYMLGSDFPSYADTFLTVKPITEHVGKLKDREITKLKTCFRFPYPPPTRE